MLLFTERNMGLYVTVLIAINHKFGFTIKKKTYCEYLEYISTETNNKNTRYI